jgi:hypothetical protein
LRVFEAPWGSEVREIVAFERRGDTCAPMLYIDGLRVGRSDRVELRRGLGGSGSPFTPGRLAFATLFLGFVLLIR